MVAAHTNSPTSTPSTLTTTFRWTISFEWRVEVLGVTLANTRRWRDVINR